MGDLASSICKASYNNDNKLKRVVEPFIRNTGLEGFWYWTLSDKGKFTHITTHPHMAEFFCHKELFKGHPHFRSPEHIPSCFLLPDKMSDNEYSKTQGKMNDEFALDQLFMIVNSDGNNLSGYGFGTLVGRPDLTNFYLNNLLLLSKFIKHFHNECAEIIKHSEDNAVNIANEIGDAFYTPAPLFSDIVIEEENELLLCQKDQLQLEALNMLSKKEKECVKWLIKGRSAAQIAKEMHLSPRTVEFYLVNIKHKLHCNTKKELFDCLLEWKQYLFSIFF
jgi:DNA-binding CsgD family transcriptional regulator